MLSKNFLIYKGMLTYSRYVFQVRYFLVQNSNDMKSTMFRNWAQTEKRKGFQKPVTSSPGELEQTKVNIQERLALIRQGHLKKSIDKTQDKTKLKNVVFVHEAEPLERNHAGRQLSSPHSLIGTSSKNNEELVFHNVDGQTKVHTMYNVVEKPLTDLEIDLNFIEEKMRNLSIHKQTEKVKKPKPSFNQVLEKLVMVSENHNLISSQHMRKHMNALNKGTNLFERKRPFSTASSSYMEQTKNVETNVPDETQVNLNSKAPLNSIENLSELSKRNKLKSNMHKLDVNICSPSIKNEILESKHIEVDNFEELPHLRDKFPVVNMCGPSIKNEILESKHIEVDNFEELPHLRDKFPFPKDTLNGYYQILASKFNDRSLKVEPCYRTTESELGIEWICTYHLKLPENLKVSAQHVSKKKASEIAAYKCLSLISEEGASLDSFSLGFSSLLFSNTFNNQSGLPNTNTSYSTVSSNIKKNEADVQIQKKVELDGKKISSSKRRRNLRKKLLSSDVSNQNHKLDSILQKTDKNTHNLLNKRSFSTDVQNQNNVSDGKTKTVSLKKIENLSTSDLLALEESTLQKTNANNPSVENEMLENKHIKVENLQEIRHLQEKFPFPKAVLNNYYQLLATELNDKSLKVEPCYRSTKGLLGTEWICTYHLKWPVNYKVSSQGKTKKKASAFAAIGCLGLLSKVGKISPEGLPLIYDKEAVKKLTQKKQTQLNFDITALNKMEEIVNIFKNNLAPAIEKMDYNNLVYQENKTMDQEVNLMTKSPVYLGMHQYLAKEKVDLPISNFKKSFTDLIQNNNCVIVKGEPGCGKSSRVPQYVLESWASSAASEDQLCRIAVTQPRRIAAISLAERVASERDEEIGRVVGYQVRLKSNFMPRTGRVLYCTTGILLRHIQSDPKLTTFSHIILDEAHERDVNTDLLMNLLKKAMKENDNLRVVVMSATIDAETFAEYFDGAPILNIPGFTYPVTRHYLDGCKLDVSKTLKMCLGENPQVIHNDVVEVLGYIHKNKPEGAILTFLPGWEDLVKVQKLIGYQNDVVVHLVHSKLKDSEQCKIFSRPPPGIRKIILATNIAETSITIDDVVYVVDTGMHKDQLFDNDKGINIIDLAWISKASANQRAGRAGRCAPGESFHLYTRERFDQFQDYTSPKILNSSLTKVVLDSKMFTNNMDACDFMNSLITAPEKFAVERAVDELKQLELLAENEKLTPLGRTLVNFQLEPNLAKAMVNGVVFKCTTPIVDIVTLFSSEAGLFGSLTLTNKEHIKNIKGQFCKSSDHLAMMRIYEKWLELYEEFGQYEVQKFCRNANLVPHKLEFVKKLQDVHFGYLYNGLSGSVPISEDFSDNDEMVKAVLYSGTGTVLEHRNWDIVKNRLKTNANVLVTRNNHKATIASESVNYKRHKYPSNFLVYINETRSNIRRTTTVRESSLIPAVSVLLFTNKELEILDAVSQDPVLNDDLVIVGIKNTNLQFLCDKNQANTLVDCKKAIEASYKYLIHQLTYANEEIPEFLEHWNNVLNNLGDILEKYKID